MHIGDQLSDSRFVHEEPLSVHGHHVDGVVRVDVAAVHSIGKASRIDVIEGFDEDSLISHHRMEVLVSVRMNETVRVRMWVAVLRLHELFGDAWPPLLLLLLMVLVEEGRSRARRHGQNGRRDVVLTEDERRRLRSEGLISVRLPSLGVRSTDLRRIVGLLNDGLRRRRIGRTCRLLVFGTQLDDEGPWAVQPIAGCILIGTDWLSFVRI